MMDDARRHIPPVTEQPLPVSPNPVRLWLRRGALVALFLALALIGTNLHFADYHLEKAQSGDLSAHTAALIWNPRLAPALRISARRQLPPLAGTAFSGNVDDSIAGFREAVRVSPLEVRAMARLGSTAVLGNADVPEAGTLTALADRLAPVMPQVQRELATHSLMVGDLPRAVVHMARAMVGEPGLRDGYFPVLMQLAADPSARNVLWSIAQDPRPFPWWDSFFRYVSAEEADLDALRGLVRLRESSQKLPFQPLERSYYINRLRREGLVGEAYLHWVNGLTADELLRLGYIFDGGFNLPFANSPGFGWQARISPLTGVLISRSETFGSSDDASLRVAFSGKRVRFSHVFQDLALIPGSYHLQGRVRPDQLQGRRGIRWTVFCNAGSSGSLAATDTWLGSGEWREFRVEFTVPAGCMGQRMRLESVGTRDVDHELLGTIWFDDLKIEHRQ